GPGMARFTPRRLLASLAARPRARILKTHHLSRAMRKGDAMHANESSPRPEDLHPAGRGMTPEPTGDTEYDLAWLRLQRPPHPPAPRPSAAPLGPGYRTL